eukprot:COSAG02_NODE_20259_length_840_cov_2.522267_1_plen_79_part_00
MGGCRPNDIVEHVVDFPMIFIISFELSGRVRFEFGTGIPSESGAYCAPLGMTANSIIVHNLAVIELTARLGADIMNTY